MTSYYFFYIKFKYIIKNRIGGGEWERLREPNLFLCFFTKSCHKTNKVLFLFIFSVSTCKKKSTQTLKKSTQIKKVDTNYKKIVFLAVLAKETKKTEKAFIWR